MPKHIDYFMSPASPYAYLGHARFMQIVEKHDAQVVLKPFDMVKIFSISGGLPVAQRAPQRQAYRLTELARWSAHMKRPLNLHPKFFPVPGDPASKFLIAAQHAHGTQAALRLAGLLGQAVWADEKNIADPETLAAMAQSLGLDGQALLAAAQSETVAADYARNTEDAIAADVFGVPWYRIAGENFWGQDRLDFVEQALTS